MKTHELIAKKNFFQIITLISFCALFAFIIFIKNSDQLNYGISTVLLIFLVIMVVAIISLFDKQPAFIVNAIGIGARKSILPFSALKIIEWYQIKFVELNTVQNKATKTTVLIVYKKDSNATKTFHLDYPDCPNEAIIDFVRQNANLLNYRDRVDISKDY